MTAYTADVTIQSPVVDLGDDLYAKEKPYAVDWIGTGLVTATVGTDDGGNVYPEWNLAAASLDYANAYGVFRNKHLAAITAYTSLDTLTSVAHGITADGGIVFRGTNLPSNLVVGKLYYLVADTADTFKVSLTSGGAAITDLGTLTGTIAMFVTATGKRSKPVYTNGVLTSGDELIGNLPADEAVLVGEGQASRSDANFAVIQAKTDLIGTVKSLVHW